MGRLVLLALTLLVLVASPLRWRADWPASVAVALGEATAGHQVARIGASRWYGYGEAPLPEWPAERVGLLRTGRGRPRFDLHRLAAAASSRPGAAWLIGNEANVPGQDEVDGPGYAEDFERYRRAIREADPRATIVAPNVQNMDWACPTCEGLTPGRASLDAWRAAHRERFGGEPEIDVFGLHLYDLDWDNLPMTNAARSKAELRAARAYVDSVPAWRGKPIWVTEIGVIWGYPGYAIRSDGLLEPTGAYDDAAVSRYLAEMIMYMRDDPDRVGVERWFVFTNAPYREPFASAPAGLALFNGTGPDARLTSAGRTYARLAGARRR